MSEVRPCERAGLITTTLYQHHRISPVCLQDCCSGRIARNDFQKPGAAENAKQIIVVITGARKEGLELRDLAVVQKEFSTDLERFFAQVLTR